MRLKENNIVFLTPGFPKDEMDTNCIPILQNYILYYKKYNPDKNIAVIAFQYPFKRSVYKWNNIEVYAAGGKNRKGIFKLITWITVVFFFWQIHLRHKTNVIHSFWLTECAFVGQILSALFSVSLLATILGQDCLPSNKYLPYLRFSKMKVIASSSFAANKFQESTSKESSATISIGIDIENFTSPPSIIPSFDIVGVGNLHAIKNFSLFIEIIHELKKEFPTIRCKIIGNGEEYPLLTQLIKKNQSEKNIELAGELPRKKVLEIMAASSILLHTSVHEGQGYVFEEALYSGMSIVAMKVGNLESGEKVKLCKNKTELTEAIRQLLTTPPKRERVLFHSMEESIKKYNELYFKQN